MKLCFALLLLAAACVPARQEDSEAQTRLAELIGRLDREIRDRRQDEEAKQSQNELRQELRREIDSEFGTRLAPIERKLESMLARLAEVQTARETREKTEAETHAKIQKTFLELEALARKVTDAMEADRRERAELERSVKNLGDQLRRQPAELDRKLDAMRETLEGELVQALGDAHASFRKQSEKKLEDLSGTLKRSSQEGGARDEALSEKLANLTSSVQDLATELDETERGAKASRDSVTLGLQALEKKEGSRSAELKTMGAELRKLVTGLAAERERRRKAESELGARLDALTETVTHGLQTFASRLEDLESRPVDAGKEKTRPEPAEQVAGISEPPAGRDSGKGEPGSARSGGPAIEPDIWEHPLSLAAGGFVLLILLYLLFRREDVEHPSDAGHPEVLPHPAPAAEPPERASKEPVLIPSASERTAAPRRKEAAEPIQPPAPRVQSLRVSEVISGGDEAVRALLAADPRVLVEPTPRIEHRADGSLSIRFYVLGSVDPLDLEAIAGACRALATRGEALPRSAPSVERSSRGL